MSHPIRPGRARGMLRRALILFFSLGVIALGIAPAAQAAELQDVVDPHSITLSVCDGGPASCATTTPKTPDAPIDQWASVRLDMNWSVPDGTKSGDTFSVQLGDPFTLYTGSFALKTKDDVKAGTCTAAAGTGLVTCTLGDFVETHENVRGGLWFAAQASKTSEAGSTDVTLSGKPATVEHPGVVGVGNPADEQTLKSGWVDYPRTPDTAATLTWALRIAGSEVTDPAGLDLTDTLSGTQKFTTETLNPIIRYAPVGEDLSTGEVLSSDLAPVEITSDTTISIHLPDLHAEGLVDPDTKYQFFIQYHSVPDDAAAIPPGTTFTNTVTGTKNDLTRDVTYAVTGNGSAEGDTRCGCGGFTVAKVVQGLPEELASSTPFTVNATYTLNGDRHKDVISLSADGSPAGLAKLPAGTEVTLTEPETTVDGYTLQSAAFSNPEENENVTISEDGRTATVTIQGKATVGLTLTNTYAPTKPTPTPTTPTPTPSPSESTTSAPTTPCTTPSGSTGSPSTSGSPCRSTGTTPGSTGSTSSSGQTAAAGSTSSGSRPHGPTASRLPRTGAETLPVAAAAAALVTLGTVLILAGRRRAVARAEKGE